MLDIFVIQSSERLIDAADAIIRNHCRTVVVVEEGRVVGVLSEGDILRALLFGAEVLTPVHDHVRHDFHYLTSVDRAQALDLFLRHNLSLIPVVDENFALTHVVTVQEMLQWLSERSR